ncbi:NAD(P)-dependent oxidoreductase [Pollutimonas sp. H1-120]|uniref:NAD-dependent epimerase/dehydratase family protein n=1 Tax=Pollutimonas sp. H1-120 TaxID=3148824 RepID=UPI003B5173BB
MTAGHYTVLGGGGFIGSHLLRYLRQNDHQCFSPLRGDDSLFNSSLGHVIYCVGLTADFRSRPLDTVEAHVCLLRRLLEQAEFESLTYLSSTRVYAGATATDESSTLHVNPNQPGDLYNLSKLMGESLCLHGGRANTRVARLSNIVGLRPDPDIFIDQLLEEGRKTGRILLRTALSSRKDYLYIDDAVSALALIAASKAQGIINVASGEAVDNQQIVRILESDMGFIVDVAANAPAWDFTAIDINRLKDEFAIQPRLFSDYFPEFLKLYRRNKGFL